MAFGLAEKLIHGLFAEKYNLDEKTRQEYIRILIRNDINTNIIRQKILSGDDKKQIRNLFEVYKLGLLWFLYV